jgi:hypothetical protein
MSYIDKIVINTLRCHSASRREWSYILKIICHFDLLSFIVTKKLQQLIYILSTYYYEQKDKENPK